MRAFVELYQSIDQTTKTNEKVAAMEAYFATASAADAAWAMYFLSGQKLQRLINTSRLREWAAELADIPLWLIEESYDWVGDLAETLAAVVPNADIDVEGTLTEWVESKLLPLRNLPPEEQRPLVQKYWQEMSLPQRFVLNKLVTGSLRVGVSQKLLVRALANWSAVPVEVLSHRLMGKWKPTPEFFREVINPNQNFVQDYQPYPFCLAHPIEGDISQLGAASDYLAEWKWDGIRAQVIRRSGQLFVWSRGEERLEDRFPEFKELSICIPNGTVLDGEILAWKDAQPLPFAELQRRIGRKTIGKKLLAEVPIAFVAFDVLEHNGQDLRDQSIQERRHALESLVSQASCSMLQLSRQVVRSSWSELEIDRQACRTVGAEGLMLKHLSSAYAVGRARGSWWKWKIEPYAIDAVLTAAQRGHGRRASLYTDYTFSLWRNNELVPFAKAYSGLTDVELRKVDQFVRQNTIDRFGPVRTVTPKLVMEIAFENLQISKRHKSGVAVRFPRILRWRHDKLPEHANTLDDLTTLMPNSESESE